MRGSVNVIETLMDVLKQRKAQVSETSYVSSLYKKGTDKIAQKVGEEAVESVIAAVRLDAEKIAGLDSRETRDEFLKESADMLFHWMVLCSHLDVDLDEVWGVLEDRQGLSGLEEKASRS